MRIEIIELNNGKSLSDNAKESAIATLVSYAKTYELLHKQLWKKDKLKEAGTGYTNYDAFGNVTTYVPNETRVNLINYEITINDRPAKPIRFWNIKSWSPNPYSATDLYALGLNQLFVGQSPYSKYDGNPKDGIYHDDCLIQPKRTDLPSFDTMGWYIEGHGHWRERDTWGEVLTTNVYTYEKFKTVVHPEIPDNPETPENEYQAAWTEQVSLGMYYVVVTPSGSSEYPLTEIERISGELVTRYYPSVEYINFTTQGVGDTVYEYYPQWAELPDYTAEHGAVVYEATDVAYIRPKGVFDIATAFFTPPAITRVYADGTCIQIAGSIGWEVNNDGASWYETNPASIAYLPLVYTDTGDLVQNRVDFIETWDDMFELYVHEDSYWYMDALGIVIIIVVMIIAYYTGYYSSELVGVAAQTAGVVSAAFAGIGAIGALTGNKALQIIGILGSLYSLGANTVGSAVSQNAMQKGLSERAASQLASEAVVDLTVMEAFQGLAQVGLKGMMQVALQVNSLINVMASTSMSDILPTEETQAEDGMVMMIGNEEDNYVSRIMKIGDLPDMTV